MIQEQKRNVKRELDAQVSEQEEGIMQIIHNLEELQQTGIDAAELNALVSDFLVASGDRGADLIFANDSLASMFNG